MILTGYVFLWTDLHSGRDDLEPRCSASTTAHVLFGMVCSFAGTAFPRPHPVWGRCLEPTEHVKSRPEQLRVPPPEPPLTTRRELEHQWIGADAAAIPVSGACAPSGPFGPAGTASTHVNMEDDDLLDDTSWWDGVQADADAAEAAAAAAGAARS